MEEILKSAIIQHLLPPLIVAIGAGLVALVAALFRMVMIRTGLDKYEVANNVRLAIQDAAFPIVSKYFHDVSVKVKSAASDGKITKEERDTLLKEAGENALKEFKALYPDTLKKLHPELQKAEEILRNEMKHLYEELKKKYFSQS